MNRSEKPVLSIGIIFKNEARCLERCLKSLKPLQEAVPCELVMADTGSNDGSREIAEKYADILFDFPWINDFAAARNAVMDRCSGAWYFSIDCDEWLDQDISVLLRFLKDEKKRQEFVMGAVMVRNYVSEDLETQYSDLLGVRLVRMDTGARYEGSIHEHWRPCGGIYGMDKMILHHDGYIGLSGEKGRPKRERNMPLLRQELEKNPKSIMCLIQCIESCEEGPECEEYLERAVRGVEEKWPSWDVLGPAVFRHVVRDAKSRNLPDLDEKAARARELFPDSPFITIDVTYIQFNDHIEKKDYAGAIPYGEAYLSALEEYHRGGEAAAAAIHSSLSMVSAVQGRMTRILMADVYFHVKEYEKSRDMLATLHGEELNEICAKNYVGVLVNLQTQSGLEMSGHMAEFWEQITKPLPSGERAAERQRGVAEVAVQLFSKERRNEEDKQGLRHGYTVFLRLAGRCGWGDAAAILEETDPEKLRALLGRVEKWNQCPIEALAHALECGAAFPLPEKPLMLEEMDSLAGRLARDRESLLRLTGELGEISDLQSLLWARGLLLAAVQVCGWKDGGDVELVRRFAAVEEKFLEACYSPQARTAENLFVLPQMHRFGWHCARAFAALDGGDCAGYVRCLREGLASCKTAKPVVEFLLEHTPQLRDPAPELLELAEKIRGLLASYAPDDPAVEALKQSPAYQKAAYLIEGTQPPVLGGLAQ